MDKRLVEYLRQMGVGAENSIEFIAGLSYQEFEMDLKTQRAVTMSLILVGEAAAKIAEHFPAFIDAHPEIAWTEIRGMRNRIAHEYFQLNFETIWQTIESELPLLLRQLAPVVEERS